MSEPLAAVHFIFNYNTKRKLFKARKIFIKKEDWILLIRERKNKIFDKIKFAFRGRIGHPQSLSFSSPSPSPPTPPLPNAFNGSTL